MGLGLGLAVGVGYGTFEAIFRGQPAEPEDGERDGQFAADGIDATPETTETIHVGIHLIKLRNGVWAFTSGTGSRAIEGGHLRRAGFF